ncbi:winged helix-turn-helix transcriptional regulator [Microbacterium sp. NPDC003461]
MFVVTADQRNSQEGTDLVPAALDAIGRIGADALPLPAERTAGDEIQALVDDGAVALSVALALTRTGHWSVGIGVGAVETPLPEVVRAARGAAFLHAREAVDDAKGSPTRLALRGAEPEAAADAEALLRLLVELRDRRSDEGWEVHDLLAEGLSQREIARRLGITESAVSRRVRSAALRTEEAAVPALARLLARLDALG